MAPLPDYYGPLFAPSAVLAYGRVIIVGGEYNMVPSIAPMNRTRAAIYHPVADQWTSIPEPAFFRTGYVIDSASTMGLSWSSILWAVIFSMYFERFEVLLSFHQVTWLQPSTPNHLRGLKFLRLSKRIRSINAALRFSRVDSFSIPMQVKLFSFCGCLNMNIHLFPSLRYHRDI